MAAGGSFTSTFDSSVALGNIGQWSAGSGWGSVGASGLGSYVYALAYSDQSIIAGGSFFAPVNTTPVNAVAEWNGTSWRALGQGLGGQVNALAVCGSILFAGGFFVSTADGAVTLNYVAQWDGAAWSALGSGLGYNVYSLACLGRLRRVC